MEKKLKKIELFDELSFMFEEGEELPCASISVNAISTCYINRVCRNIYFNVKTKTPEESISCGSLRLYLYRDKLTDEEELVDLRDPDIDRLCAFDLVYENAPTERYHISYSKVKMQYLYDGNTLLLEFGNE